jgi:hypothetical protein
MKAASTHDLEVSTSAQVVVRARAFSSIGSENVAV